MNNNEYILQDVYNGGRFNRKETMSVETFVRRANEYDLIPTFNDSLLLSMILTVLNDCPVTPFYIIPSEKGDNSSLKKILNGRFFLECLDSFVTNFCKIPDGFPPISCIAADNSNSRKAITYDISGQYFKDMPEVFRNKILWYNLNFCELENYKKEDILVLNNILEWLSI